MRRERLAAIQRKLQAALAPRKPAPDAGERIFACAEEFGVDPALERVDSSPDQFGVRLRAEARKVSRRCFARWWRATAASTVSWPSGEKKLREADHKRLPVNQFQGREFQIDPKKGTRTFLDAPDKPERLER